MTYYTLLASNRVSNISEIGLAIVPSWAEWLLPAAYAYSYAYSHLPKKDTSKGNVSDILKSRQL